MGKHLPFKHILLLGKHFQCRTDGYLGRRCFTVPSALVDQCGTPQWIMNHLFILYHIFQNRYRVFTFHVPDPKNKSHFSRLFPAFIVKKKGSEHHIRIVLLIDLTYNKSKKPRKSNQNITLTRSIGSVYQIQFLQAHTSLIHQANIFISIIAGCYKIEHLLISN